MKKSLKLTAAVLLTVFCLFYTGCDFIQSLLEPTNIEETDNKKDSDDTERSRTCQLLSWVFLLFHEERGYNMPDSAQRKPVYIAIDLKS